MNVLIRQELSETNLIPYFLTKYKTDVRKIFQERNTNQDIKFVKKKYRWGNIIDLLFFFKRYQNHFLGIFKTNIRDQSSVFSNLF